jgi:apolipoprotein N-acyltransferase
MKTINNSLNKAALVLAGLFTGLATFAQEKSADIDVNIKTDKGSNWYAQPWVWIVGGAVFILLLVALLRGGGNRAKD